MSGDELEKKIKTVKDLLIVDETIVNEFYNLKKKFIIADIEEGKKCELDITDETKIVTCLQTITGARRVLNEYEEEKGRILWDQSTEVNALLKEYLDDEDLERKEEESDGENLGGELKEFDNENIEKDDNVENKDSAL